MLAAVATYVASSQRAKVYDARAIVRIIPAGQSTGTALSPDALAQVANAYAQLAESTSVTAPAEKQLRGVVLGVNNDSRSSGLLDLTGTSRQPKLAAAAANAYALAFVARVQSVTDQDRQAALQRVSTRVAEIQRQLRSTKADAADTGLTAELQALQARSAEVQTQNTDAAQILSRAQPPKAPASPRPARDALLAAIAALLLAMAAIYLRAYVSTHYRSADEAATDLALPLLAEVARESRGQTNLEAFRVLRANVGFALAGTDPTTGVVGEAPTNRAVLIAAPHAAAGKTHVCTNLARAMAASGRQVVAVDADLRKPDVHHRFGVDLTPGLVDILSGGEKPHLQKVEAGDPGVTSPGDLSVLAAGRSIEESSELLSSPAMNRLLHELRRDHDWVVVDTPPLLSVADAALLARLADAVIFVVEASKTTRRDAHRGLEALRQAGAHVIGVVINGSQDPGLAYGYGYGYGSQSVAARP